MPRYLIHVGPHKTGTTYLQLRFDTVQQRLRQAGVAYPGEWRSAEAEPSHRKLVVALRAGSVERLQSDFAIIERNDPDHVLISAEGINHLAPPALALLKTLTRGQPVTIIFYCRRWSELLPSLWQERVKHGHAETFSEFFATHVDDPFASLVLNFARRIDIYADVFGRSNIRLVSYSTLGDAGIDLAEHFFANFLPRHRGLIDADTQPMAMRPNASLPVLDVEVMRALNALAASDNRPPGSALREWYVAQSERSDLAALFATMQADQATLTFCDAGPATAGLLRMLSTAYRDIMVEPIAGDYLFAPRRAEIAFVGQRYLADRSARQALQALYAAFRRDMG